MSLHQSDSLAAIPPYPFAAMEQLIRERRRAGKEVLMFSIGDPDFPTPSFISDAVAEAMKDPAYHGYSSSEGEPWFREAVSTWYHRRFGVDVDPDSEVCALIGSKEGLANVAKALVNPGDKVLVPDPGYPVYARGGATLSGGTPVRFGLDAGDGFAPKLDPRAMKGAKLAYANFPNNPTGSILPEDVLSDFVRSVQAARVPLCYDNAYSEMTFGAHPAPSVLQLGEGREGLIEMHSCSKTFSMTGYRVGFAVGDSRLVAALKKVKSQVDSGPPKFLQLGARVALESYTGRSRPRFVTEMVEAYGERLRLLVKGLKRMGQAVEVPPATFYLWQKTTGPGSEFAKRLAEKGILVTPGASFGTAGEHYVRWSVTQGHDRIRRALELLRA